MFVNNIVQIFSLFEKMIVKCEKRPMGNCLYGRFYSAPCGARF